MGASQQTMPAPRPVVTAAAAPARPLPSGPYSPPEITDPASSLRAYAGWTVKRTPVYAPRPPIDPKNAVASKGAAMPGPVSYNSQVFDAFGRQITGDSAAKYLEFADSDLAKQYEGYSLAPVRKYSQFIGGVNPYTGGPYAPGGFASYGTGNRYSDRGIFPGNALIPDYGYGARVTPGQAPSWGTPRTLGHIDYLPYSDVNYANDRYFLPHTDSSGQYVTLPKVLYQGKNADAERQYQYLLAMGHPAALKEKERRDIFARERQLQDAADVRFLAGIRTNTAKAQYIADNFSQIPVSDPNHGKEWQQAVQAFLNNSNIAYTKGYDYYGRTEAERAQNPNKATVPAMMQQIAMQAKFDQIPGHPLAGQGGNFSTLLAGQKMTNRIPDRIWNRLSPAERNAITKIEGQRALLQRELVNPFSAFTYNVTDKDVYGSDLSKKPVLYQTRGPGGILFGGNPGATSWGWRNDNPVPPEIPGTGLWVAGKDPNDPRTLAWAYDFAMDRRVDRPKKGGLGGTRFDQYVNWKRQNPDGTWNKITDPKLAQQLLGDVDAYIRELAYRMDLPKRTFSFSNLLEAFIPAMVGIATGNPYLAGMAAFGQAASKGDIAGMVTSALTMGVNAYGGFGKLLSNVGINPGTIVSKVGTLTSIPKVNTWLSGALQDFLDPTKVGGYSYKLGDFARDLGSNVLSQLSDMEIQKLRREPFYGQMYASLTPQQRAQYNLPAPNLQGQYEDYARGFSRLNQFASGEGSQFGDDWFDRARNYVAGTTSPPAQTPVPAARGGLMALPSKYKPVTYRRRA